MSWARSGKCGKGNDAVGRGGGGGGGDRTKQKIMQRTVESQWLPKQLWHQFRWHGT
jgi:hypothetical protein